MGFQVKCVSGYGKLTLRNKNKLGIKGVHKWKESSVPPRSDCLVSLDWELYKKKGHPKKITLGMKLRDWIRKNGKRSDDLKLAYLIS